MMIARKCDMAGRFKLKLQRQDDGDMTGLVHTLWVISAQVAVSNQTLEFTAV